MARSFLIAFGKKPLPTFIDMLVKMAANDGVTISSALLREGPGCTNLGLMVDAKGDEENFIQQLTIVLQPAKYEEYAGEELKEDQFIDEINVVLGLPPGNEQRVVVSAPVRMQ